jgi:hypothetical protein
MAKTRIFVALAILFLAKSAFALQTSELVGRWTVSWPKTQTQNSISLSFEKGRLFGSYVSGEGKVCEVAGKLPEEEILLLQINCEKWNVEMKGNISADGGSISGFYTYHYQGATNDLDRFYIPPWSAHGKFAMSKNHETSN